LARRSSIPSAPTIRRARSVCGRGDAPPAGHAAARERKENGTDGNYYGIGTQPRVQSSVYRLTPSGNLTILKTYPDSNTYYPDAEFLVQARNGMLYGTAGDGGAYSSGAIFRISTSGQNYQVLYSFPKIDDGLPSFLTVGSDGNLYGAADGVQNAGVSSLFRVTPKGKFEKLHILNGISEGHCPCSLTVGTDGKFYGTVGNGGPGGGVVFSWDVGMPPPKPSLRGVWPTKGSAGASVTLWGNYLLGATAVSFNGVPATINSVMGQFVSVTVPAGATTGPVSITTPNGSATAKRSFIVQ
jgi:uncharacterized repeat protein (TIGR03803 family)